MKMDDEEWWSTLFFPVILKIAREGKIVHENGWYKHIKMMDFT